MSSARPLLSTIPAPSLSDAPAPAAAALRLSLRPSRLCVPCSCRAFPAVSRPAPHPTARSSRRPTLVARRLPLSASPLALFSSSSSPPPSSPLLSRPPPPPPPPPYARLAPLRTMSSSAPPPPPPASRPPQQGRIFFGPFDVTTQVFYATPLSFALVNLKPLLPGHVLVCPRRLHRRLTDLNVAELADLFAAVQVVQRMLAAYYFGPGDAGAGAASVDERQVHRGSFNLAIQDGPEAGQTVAHVHVHVLPRIRGATAKNADTEGDALYDKMAAEPGNVGGAQWDAAVAEDLQGGSGGTTATSGNSASGDAIGRRPKPGGRFPRIEDSHREARTMAAMEAEAAEFRRTLAELGIAQHGDIPK